ncbi:CAP domain-containing protein [Gordonia sp. (in: high G+C Gram-positive bacteria)]|uniref:CAP domain-containing protein n=1 Tax=Gordonia sp. (in: high G+C Gram-positive bacteria) TaxID=84139 RepID=UPI001D296990|nr:CAP domain-containing protein [Gordonia sp. (in: high G+C Gram-positive bacteria)]MCB1295692.1 CAP domain-containing protein [Gordonia sp. (in: high G+C Gram-positive bacteria)]HMS75101.1 CAP domain-containing protein [Gordonia sp. (in: high G+C Gram-positive bacteria)]HQV17939.1 CAP domain-containing protein [Gordonia sp. (in: high G+C Gram-positive bacteria)]
MQGNHRAGKIDGVEDELVALANGARAGSGLGTLWVHQGLVGFARGHAATLAAELNLYHQDMTPILDQTDLNWAAENVACGQPDAATAHLAWWNSPGHRENLMNPEFDRIGVGVAQGRNGTWFYVQLFGRTAAP